MDQPYEAWLQLSVDHVIPRATLRLGYPDAWVEDLANLVTCYRACNEFLNGYRVTDPVPASEAEFFDLRDAHFAAKQTWILERHDAERARYEAGRAAPTITETDDQADDAGLDGIVRRRLPEATEAVVGGGIAALAFVDPVWALVGAAAAPLAGAFAAEIERRRSIALEVIEDESLTPQELAEAIQRRPEVMELWTTVMDGIRQRRDRAQLRLLARALARGIRGDDATLDVEARFARTAANLDVPELKLLTILVGPWHARKVGEIDVAADQVTRDELRGAWPDAAGVLEAMLARLVGAGLAHLVPTIDGQPAIWQATSHARDLLRRLEDEGWVAGAPEDGGG